MTHLPMRPSTIDAARGKWRDILTSFGVPAKALNGKHHPCPACGGKDRFRFADKEGSGNYFCSGCGHGYGISLVQKMTGLDFKGAAQAVDRAIGNARLVASLSNETDPNDLIAKMKETWSDARRVEAGDLVATWLRTRAGVTKVPECLRFHDALRYRDDKGIRYPPAMLARVDDLDGKLAMIHRTWLSKDGRAKADVESARKTMAGTIPDGAAVRLMEHGEDLGIAEGIETAFAASRMFGVPCWSALNAGMLEKWRPPATVKRVHIFGDADSSFTGQRAAFILARALVMMKDGPEVKVHLPDTLDQDWRDVWAEYSIPEAMAA